MASFANTLMQLAPHGFCLSWRPDLLALHIASDALTALAYASIPVMLLWFVRRRTDLQFGWMFVLFGIFITACGATHVMSIWTLWFPDYLVAGLVKAWTALVSIATTIALWPLLPRALALPGPAEWRAINQKLQSQVAERHRAEDEVRRLNTELEQRVQARTAELMQANERLRQLHEELELRVEERTNDLRQAQAALVASARQAGMAEVAINVLHNVGNVLNSVNVSTNLILQRLQQPLLEGLGKSVGMLRDNAADLGTYLAEDDKGRRLVDYLDTLHGSLVRDQQEILAESVQLSQSVDHIKSIVASQQAYAGTSTSSSMVAPTTVETLVYEALRINGVWLSRLRAVIDPSVAESPRLMLDSHRTLQILVNLVSNAKQAMEAPRARGLTLHVSARWNGSDHVDIIVRDEGDGIEPGDLPRIFAHGFTTRQGGHGFGLHSCIIAAHDMGGTLTASSHGRGQGAAFTLSLPARPASEATA